MRKFRKLLSRRNTSGFTLVEVIVSCALLAILILAVVGMISPVMNIVMSNKSNANALMIAEATEAYIDRSIKNSVFVAVFTNAKSEEFVDAKIDEHEAVKEMKEFLKDGDNKDIYDLNVIGIRWLEDPKTHLKKYMLEVIRPNYDSTFSLPGTGTKYTSKPVFETCFYDNLYPNISFEVMPYVEKDETGAAVSTRNAALKTTIDVYTNPEMTSLAATGEGYADFINIRTPAINRDDTYKLYHIVDKDETGAVLKDAMGNDITLGTQLRTDTEYNASFSDPTDTSNPKAETYIFYVTRKLKYYEAPPVT